jgi:valyl-tRNA synthetase
MDQPYREYTKAALEKLSSMGRISHAQGHWYLDRRAEARMLKEALQNGQIAIEPLAHKGRLIAMLSEESLRDIGRDQPWGISAQGGYAFDGTPMKAASGCSITLDTWFGSALWPWAIGGEDAFFDALIIGYDIAYFWGARMLMMALALGKPYPFKRMMLNGLIREAKGQKFSKSLGNGIDPMDIIRQSGSDALRLWCCTKASWGMILSLIQRIWL